MRTLAEQEEMEQGAYQDYLRRKKQLMKRRKRQSRMRRMRRKLFHLFLFALVAAAGVYGLSQISRLPVFRKKIDVAQIEIPRWIDQNLIEPNPNSRPQTPLEEVNGVVVHYVGNPGTTAQQNRSYFNSLAETHKDYASSHFVVGLDGEIIQCVPLDEIAYCSNDRNHDTISIECCHPDDSGAFTQETYDALLKLTRWLCDTFGLDSSQDVIRHYDVTGKECPRYYVRNPQAWEQFIQDLQ